MAVCPLFLLLKKHPMCRLFLIINSFSSHRARQQMCLMRHQDVVSPPVRSLVVFIVCFLYGQLATLVHHNAVLISSSLREHRLRLSSWTYSPEPTLLFEQWWTDVRSIDGLSCYIMSAHKKHGLIYALHSWVCHKTHMWVSGAQIILQPILGWLTNGYIRGFIAQLWSK